MSLTNEEIILLSRAGYTYRSLDGQWNDPLAGHPVPEATALRRAREDAETLVRKRPTIENVPTELLELALSVWGQEDPMIAPDDEPRYAAGTPGLCWCICCPFYPVSDRAVFRRWHGDGIESTCDVVANRTEVAAEIKRRRDAQKEPAMPETDDDLLARVGYSPVPNGAWCSPTTGQLMSKEAALAAARKDAAAAPTPQEPMRAPVPSLDLIEAARAFVDLAASANWTSHMRDAWNGLVAALDRAEAQAQRAAPASSPNVLDEIEAAYRALHPDAELVAQSQRVEQRQDEGCMIAGYVADVCASGLDDIRRDAEESALFPTRREALAALLALLRERIATEERAATDRAARLAAFRAGRA